MLPPQAPEIAHAPIAQLSDLEASQIGDNETQNLLFHDSDSNV